MLKKTAIILFVVLITAFIFPGCGNSGQSEKTVNDSISQVNATDSIFDEDSTKSAMTTAENNIEKNTDTLVSKTKNVKIAKPKVNVYYFHGANRCVSCVAIEEVTKKTINTYYKKELSEGIIEFKTIDIEESKNKVISEKYQVFGSSLFVTKILNGSETKTDLTGDGFKYAKNKEEKFIEILRKTITDYLK